MTAEAVTIKPTEEEEEILSHAQHGFDGEKVKEGEIPYIEHAYILEDNRVISARDVFKNDGRTAKIDASHSNQSVEEGPASIWEGVIETPYDPNRLAAILQVDTIHSRCCITKTVDAVGRPWKLMPKVEGKDDRDDNVIQDEEQLINWFIESCNPDEDFEDIFYCASMDFQSVGWGAIEVVRSLNKRARYIYHVPATRIRKTKDGNFVEILPGGALRVYQAFGRKVVSKRRKDLQGNPEVFDPYLDKSFVNAEWNLVDKDTGELTDELENSANEILFIRNHHPGTVHYGIPNIVPAVGYVLSNIHIRDYLLQFFENNTIPNYAIIVKGVKLAPEVLQLIQKYFAQEIRGHAHKTLLIPLPTARSEVAIEFVKLQQVREAGHQVTRKNNDGAIMVAHGVSPAIIGIADTANLGSGKGLSQAEIYKDRIVSPLQRLWSRKISKLFRYGLGVLNVQFMFDPLDIRDRATEANIYSHYQREGTLSINEVRQAAKLGEPIKDGDEHLINSGGTPVPLSYVVEGGTVQSPEDDVDSTGEDSGEEDEDKSVEEKSPPCRREGESEKDCVSRKIPEIMAENPSMSQDQAVAIASSMCAKQCKDCNNESED